MTFTFFDIECYKNYFLIIFKRNNKYYEFEIYNDQIINGNVNEVKNILKSSYIVGYNSNGYDLPLLEYYLNYKGNMKMKNITLYNKSQQLIKADKLFYSNNLSIDLQSLLFQPDVIKEDGKKKVVKKSLKHIGVMLKHSKLQELPYKFDSVLDDNQIRVIKSYCMNDVDITEKLFYNKQVQKKLDTRFLVKNKYNLNCLSDSNSTLCNKLIKKFYGEDIVNITNKIDSLKLSEVDNKVTFKTKEANEFLDRFLNYSTTDVILPEKLFGLEFKFGIGGIHSKDKKGIFISDEDIEYIESDIASQYPSIIINDEIYPRHLNKKILIIYKEIRDDRMKIKKTDPMLSDVYKIILNSFYGKFKSKGILYDPLCALKVVVKGQLMILNLIERLYLEGFEVISANTDGIITKVEVKRKAQYEEIIEQWSKDFKVIMEFTKYEKYIRRDISNYIAIKSKENVKFKGCYLLDLDDFEKGYNFPVVIKAVQNYYINNVDIETYIKNHKDIYDFCKAQKIGKEFKVLYDNQEVQSSCRFFISTDGKDLVKTKTIIKDNVEKEYTISLQKDKKITLFNDYYESNNYNIDYEFYIELAKKLII